jgi:hypothetical protein
MHLVHLIQMNQAHPDATQTFCYFTDVDTQEYKYCFWRVMIPMGRVPILEVHTHVHPYY